MNPLFISNINENLKDLFNAYSGSKVYGLAETIVRQYGDVEQFMPSLINGTEAQYIGLDDAASIIVYHKSNSINISDKNNSGYGDVKALKNYSYSNVMVLAYNNLIVKLSQDELMILIEANFPEFLNIENYKQVGLKTETVNLNTLSVFNSEYKGSIKAIPLNFRMMAVYYRIDSLFDKNCFPKCPKNN